MTTIKDLVHDAIMEALKVIDLKIILTEEQKAELEDIEADTASEIRLLVDKILGD